MQAVHSEVSTPPRSTSKYASSASVIKGYLCAWPRRYKPLKESPEEAPAARTMTREICERTSSKALVS